MGDPIPSFSDLCRERAVSARTKDVEYNFSFFLGGRFREPGFGFSFFLELEMFEMWDLLLWFLDFCAKKRGWISLFSIHSHALSFQSRSAITRAS